MNSTKMIEEKTRALLERNKESERFSLRAININILPRYEHFVYITFVYFFVQSVYLRNR